MGLISLDVSFNNLTELPAWLGTLTNLQELELNNNGLTCLPEELGELKELTSLNVDTNKLRALPFSIGSLSKLRELRMDENLGVFIPDSLFSLSSLSWLDIGTRGEPSFRTSAGDNVFPEAFGDLASLAFLSTRAHSLPSSFCRLANLLKVELCHMSVFPEYGDQPELHTLWISSSDAEGPLPHCYSRLSGLDKLYLSGCKNLTCLPAPLAALTNLDSLHVERSSLLGNAVSELSECFAGMTALRSLHLEDCGLAEVRMVFKYSYVWSVLSDAPVRLAWPLNPTACLQ